MIVLDSVEDNPIGNDAHLDVRAQAKGAARWFYSSPIWMPLARIIAEIWSKKTFKAWGYSSFRAYCDTELDVPKPTAADLRLAYAYVALHHPECLEEAGSAADLIPSYTSLAMLARHRSRLTEETAESLDKALFSGALTRTALKKALFEALAPQSEPPRDATAETPSLTNEEPPTEHRGLLESLQLFYAVIDLHLLREQLTEVFNSWEEAPLADRRQLFGQLLSMLDQLELFKATIQANTNSR